VIGMESTHFHTIGTEGIRASQVTLTDAGGARLSVPFDGAFLRTGR